jgi:uncharacterized protein (DUF3084 family)
VADEPDLKFLAEQVARMIAEARGSTAAAAVNAQDLFRLRAEVEAVKISNAEIRAEVEAVRTEVEATRVEVEAIRPEVAAVKVKVDDLADGQRGLLTALQGVREALDAILKKLP